MFDNPHSHQFLSVVPPVHHQGVGQAFDDGALGFAEALHGVAACGVGDVDGGADLDVISVVSQGRGVSLTVPKGEELAVLSEIRGEGEERVFAA